MRRDGTHAAKVHELLFAAAKERVEAGAKEVDREIIVLALDAGSPEGGHAFAALEGRIERTLIAVGGTLCIDALEFEGDDFTGVDVGGTEDGA